MAVATGTAIAIMAGASVASNVASAKIKANAAKKAADAANAGVDKSNALGQRVYQDQMRQMQPWLSGRSTNPFGQAMGGPGPQGAFGSPQPGPGAPSPLGQALGGPQAPMGGRPPMGAPMGQQGPPMGQQGGMVTMRAPTGETTQVPDHLASQFEAKGAVRV